MVKNIFCFFYHKLKKNNATAKKKGLINKAWIINEL